MGEKKESGGRCREKGCRGKETESKDCRWSCQKEEERGGRCREKGCRGKETESKGCRFSCQKREEKGRCCQEKGGCCREKGCQGREEEVRRQEKKEKEEQEVRDLAKLMRFICTGACLMYLYWYMSHITLGKISTWDENAIWMFDDGSLYPTLVFKLFLSLIYYFNC